MHLRSAQVRKIAPTSSPKDLQNFESVARLAPPKSMLKQHLLLYIMHIGLTRLGTDSGAADLTAPPCHRPRRVREVFRRFREVFGAKLCQNAFQTIPVNSIFGEKNFVRRFFFASDIVFRLFGPVLELLQANGPHHQLPRNFLL